MNHIIWRCIKRNRPRLLSVFHAWLILLFVVSPALIPLLRPTDLQSSDAMRHAFRDTTLLAFSKYLSQHHLPISRTMLLFKQTCFIIWTPLRIFESSTEELFCKTRQIHFLQFQRYQYLRVAL